MVHETYCFQLSHFKNITQVFNLFSTERGFFSTLVKKDPSDMKPCEDQEWISEKQYSMNFLPYWDKTLYIREENLGPVSVNYQVNSRLFANACSAVFPTTISTSLSHKLCHTISAINSHSLLSAFLKTPAVLLLFPHFQHLCNCKWLSQ